MFNKEYILQEAANNNLRSFKAHSNDGRGSIVKDTPTTKEIRYNELKDFLDNAKGAYQVEMWDCYDIMPKKNQRGRTSQPDGRCFFRGEIFLKEDSNEKIGALEPFNGVPSLHTIQTYEKEKNDIKDENRELKTKIMLLERDIEMMKKEHERELKEATAQDQKIMGYLGQLSGILGGTPSQMGNIETVKEQKQTMNKEKLVNAVNDLCQLDPNFDEHLSKLAQIAKSKPEIYKIAINQLSNL